MSPRAALLSEARSMLGRLPVADYSGLQALRSQQSAISAEKLVLEESLPDFFRAAWQVLQPRYPLTWSWHYSLICEYLALIRAGKFHQHFPEIGRASCRESGWV